MCNLFIWKHLERNYNVSYVVGAVIRTRNSKLNRISLKGLRRFMEDRYLKPSQWSEINNLIIATAISEGLLCIG